MLRTLLQWDANLTAKLRLQQQSGALWPWAVFFSHSGDSWWWLAGLFPIWLLGIFFWPRWHTIAAVLAFSLLVEAVVVLAIKFAIRRKRPDGDWGDIYRSTDPHSFPSGHAARMLLIAVMSWGIAPLWFAIVLTIWAPLVCVARVMTGVHYLSDVVAGGVIGILSGFLMLWAMPVIIPLINSFLPFAF